MRGDRRQIQTAVLGGADSEEPLMLPLEAIELDAFRRRHEHDSFWCGLLLGGCGLQLTTKLFCVLKRCWPAPLTQDPVPFPSVHGCAGPREMPKARPTAGEVRRALVGEAMRGGLAEEMARSVSLASRLETINRKF